MISFSSELNPSTKKLFHIPLTLRGITSPSSMFPRGGGGGEGGGGREGHRVATLQLIPNSLCFPCALAIFPVFFLSTKNKISIF